MMPNEDESAPLMMVERGDMTLVLLVDKNLRGLESVCDQVEETGGPAAGYCQLDSSQLV